MPLLFSLCRRHHVILTLHDEFNNGLCVIPVVDVALVQSGVGGLNRFELERMVGVQLDPALVVEVSGGVFLVLDKFHGGVRRLSVDLMEGNSNCC